MPKPKMTKADARKISKGCMLKFFSALDSCLGEQILTPEQCLRDAARQWADCMAANGITVAARSTRRARPKPKRAVEKVSKRK